MHVAFSFAHTLPSDGRDRRFGERRMVACFMFELACADIVATSLSWACVRGKCDGLHALCDSYSAFYGGL